jgi:hypothetical protein
MLAIRLSGVSIEYVHLNFFGAEIRLKNGRAVSYRNEVHRAGGSSVKLRRGILSRFGCGPVDSEWLYFFAGANVLLGTFNLLPPVSSTAAGRFIFLCS